MTPITWGTLELTRVDDDCWRICDSTLPANDPGRIIAFAEIKHDHLIVLWLRKPSKRKKFATFEKALRAAQKTIVDAEPRRSRRPVPIPHLPPLRRALG